MPVPELTYWLDRYGVGSDEDEIEINREALHGKPVTPEVAAVILLSQVDRRLRSIELLLTDISEAKSLG